MRSHGPGRGSRRYKGVQSGTTWATIPSGVTIDNHGIDSGGGTQLNFNGGNTAWAGVSLSITHGFTTLTGFAASYFRTGSTQPATVHSQDNGISGGVSVAVYNSAATAPWHVITSGGTVFWTAFGTD